MKYEKNNIIVVSPAEGHYSITGHNPRPVFVEDVGHIVPPETCYISPEVPSDLLLKIVQERVGDHPAAAVIGDALKSLDALVVEKLKRGRKPKAKAPAEPATTEPPAFDINATEGGAE